MKKYILHIDVNNAFLSWSAVYLLNNGYCKDIRKIPSIICGDPQNRTGIVLAKSPIAKKLGIKTAMTINEAKKLCPNLELFPPQKNVYKYYSNELYKILCKYCDTIERYSIDECFLDMTHCLMKKDIFEIAKQISDEIKSKLKFTVNIGISDKKYLAKISSDFEKPDKIHTLYSNEISKIYNMPLDNLFMLGKNTKDKMNQMRIMTIGDLAHSDREFIYKRFKKHRLFLHDLANGIDNSYVDDSNSKNKNISREKTLKKDCLNISDLEEILSDISYEIAIALQKESQKAYNIAIKLKYSNFKEKSFQRKLSFPIENSKQIFENAKLLLESIYDGENIRLIGIRVSQLEDINESYQLSLFDNVIENEKIKQIDQTINKINNKYNKNLIFKGSNLNAKNL